MESGRSIYRDDGQLSRKVLRQEKKRKRHEEKCQYFTEICRKFFQLHISSRSFVLCLKWILAEEFWWKVYIEQILQLVFMSKAEFHQVYEDLNQSGSWRCGFKLKEWSLIQEVMEGRHSVRYLSDDLRLLLGEWRKKINTVIEEVEAINLVESLSTFPVLQKRRYEKVFTYFMSSILPLEKIDKSVPVYFQKIKIDDSTVIVKDNNGQIIGGILRNCLTDSCDKNFIHQCIVDLVSTHALLNRGKARDHRGTKMWAYGPKQSTEKGISRDFYKNNDQINMKEISEVFNNTMDRYSHNLLVEIILCLYWRFAPGLLTSLFRCYFPYLSVKEFLENKKPCYSFENSFSRGATAYQLFITENYVSKIHFDHDANDFTLAYVSNPLNDINGGNFILASYGVELEFGDGDLFFFRGCDFHGTALRNPPAVPIYTCAVTCNARLGSIYEKMKKT